MPVDRFDMPRPTSLSPTHSQAPLSTGPASADARMFAAAARLLLQDDQHDSGPDRNHEDYHADDLLHDYGDGDTLDLRIAAIFVVLVAGFIGGIIPLLFKPPPAAAARGPLHWVGRTSFRKGAPLPNIPRPGSRNVFPRSWAALVIAAAGGGRARTSPSGRPRADVVSEGGPPSEHTETRGADSGVPVSAQQACRYRLLSTGDKQTTRPCSAGSAGSGATADAALKMRVHACVPRAGCVKHNKTAAPSHPVLPRSTQPRQLASQPAQP
eukprot:352470-Chlamydomonas_euryale.AAC.10